MRRFGVSEQCSCFRQRTLFVTKKTAPFWFTLNLPCFFLKIKPNQQNEQTAAWKLSLGKKAKALCKGRKKYVFKTNCHKCSFELPLHCKFTKKKTAQS